jgi:hypothetical protein
VDPTVHHRVGIDPARGFATHLFLHEVMHIEHGRVDILNMQRLLCGNILRSEILDKILRLIPQKKQ